MILTKRAGRSASSGLESSSASRHYPIFSFSLARVHSVAQRVASLADTWSAGTGTWIRKFADAVAVGAREERFDHSIHEPLDNIHATDKLRRNNARQVVGDSGEQEASGSRRSESAKVGTQRNEVVQSLVLSRYSEFAAAQDKVGDISSSRYERVWSRATKPVSRESLVEVEWSDVLVVGVERVSAVGQGTEDEDSLGGCDSQPTSTSSELRVGRFGLVVNDHALLSESVVAKLATVLLGDVHKTVPTVHLEVCLVSKVGVLTRDRVVDLEETVLADSERWPQSVGYASISAANAVFTRWQVTAGEQAEGRQEDASVVAKAESDLASIGGLSEGSDAASVNVSVVRHGVQRWAHPSHSCGCWLLILVVRIIPWNHLQAKLLWTGHTCQMQYV